MVVFVNNIKKQASLMEITTFRDFAKYNNANLYRTLKRVTTIKRQRHHNIFDKVFFKPMAISRVANGHSLICKQNRYNYSTGRGPINTSDTHSSFTDFARWSGIINSTTDWRR